MPIRSLIFSTANPHKLTEVQAIIGANFHLRSLAELGMKEEIEETGSTYEENAQLKAQAIYQKTGLDVFADDSGLEVEALQGAPGLFSAHYAGARDPIKNIEKVLSELADVENRNARFVCVLCLYYKGKPHFFTGIVHGTILPIASTSAGFGYDPIFQPKGFSASFSEMASELKNQLSHRGLALQKMAEWLDTR